MLDIIGLAIICLFMFTLGLLINTTKEADKPLLDMDSAESEQGDKNQVKETPDTKPTNRFWANSRYYYIGKRNDKKLLLEKSPYVEPYIDRIVAESIGHHMSQLVFYGITIKYETMYRYITYCLLALIHNDILKDDSSLGVLYKALVREVKDEYRRYFYVSLKLPSSKNFLRGYKRLHKKYELSNKALYEVAARTLSEMFITSHTASLIDYDYITNWSHEIVDDMYLNYLRKAIKDILYPRKDGKAVEL